MSCKVFQHKSENHKFVFYLVFICDKCRCYCCLFRFWFWFWFWLCCCWIFYISRAHRTLFNTRRRGKWLWWKCGANMKENMKKTVELIFVFFFLNTSSSSLSKFEYFDLLFTNGFDAGCLFTSKHCFDVDGMAPSFGVDRELVAFITTLFRFDCGYQGIHCEQKTSIKSNFRETRNL